MSRGGFQVTGANKALFRCAVDVISNRSIYSESSTLGIWCIKNTPTLQHGGRAVRIAHELCAELLLHVPPGARCEGQECTRFPDVGDTRLI